MYLFTTVPHPQVYAQKSHELRCCVQRTVGSCIYFQLWDGIHIVWSQGFQTRIFHTCPEPTKLQFTWCCFYCCSPCLTLAIHEQVTSLLKYFLQTYRWRPLPISASVFRNNLFRLIFRLKQKRWKRRPFLYGIFSEHPNVECGGWSYRCALWNFKVTTITVAQNS